MDTSGTPSFMTTSGESKKPVVLALWMLLAVYAISRVLQVYPGPVPMLGVVILHVVPAALFALVHGSVAYRLRTMLVFLFICLVVGNVFENVGVRTGFPYGPYYFTNLMGPRILEVPIFLGLAYVGMAYVSWTLARLILGIAERPLTGAQIIILPLTAAVIMVAWDFCMDPVWSTILHAWIWLRGGSYFGVPVSNFVGWYLGVYVIYQIFALYLSGRPVPSASLPAHFWGLAVVFYSVSAAGNLLLLFTRPGVSNIVDNGGNSWRVSDILAATALSSIFSMGGFALAAWARLATGNGGRGPLTLSAAQTTTE
jgi:uncharacterized membrane protein